MKNLQREYEQRKKEMKESLKVYQDACVKFARVKDEMSKL